MAWRYPKYDVKSGYVIDIDPINENFLPFVEESSGALTDKESTSGGRGVYPAPRSPRRIRHALPYRLHKQKQLGHAT